MHGCPRVRVLLGWCCCPRLIEKNAQWEQWCLRSEHDVLSWSHHHFHNYSAFICAKCSQKKNHIQAQRDTYTLHNVEILYTSTHIHLLFPLHTCCTHLKCSFSFFLFFIWTRRKLYVLRILESLGRHIEPIINYWIQRYLWDVPIQICLCQCAVLCVGGCSLSAPAPFISKQLLYIRFEGLVLKMCCARYLIFPAI